MKINKNKVIQLPVSGSEYPPIGKSENNNINNNLNTIQNVKKEIVDDTPSNTKMQKNQYESKLGNIQSSQPELIDYKQIKKSIRNNRKINFSTIEIIKINCFKCCVRNKDLRMKNDLYKLAEEKIENLLEITYVFKKLKELEKIKNIVLTREHIALSNMSFKELLSNESEKLKMSEFNQMKEFQKDPIQVNLEIEKFRGRLINRNEELNDINKILFNMLPIEMKDNLLKYK